MENAVNYWHGTTARMFERIRKDGVIAPHGAGAHERGAVRSLPMVYLAKSRTRAAEYAEMRARQTKDKPIILKVHVSDTGSLFPDEDFIKALMASWSAANTDGGIQAKRQQEVQLWQEILDRIISRDRKLASTWERHLKYGTNIDDAVDSRFAKRIVMALADHPDLKKRVVDASWSVASTNPISEFETENTYHPLHMSVIESNFSSWIFSESVSSDNVDKATAILGGDVKKAEDIAKHDPYEDKRMTPVIAGWLKAGHIIAPDEHEDDLKAFKDYRSRLKNMNLAAHVSKAKKERVRKLLSFDPTVQENPGEIQKWNRNVKLIFHSKRAWQSDTGLEVVGRHNGYTMYKIATEDDLKVPLVRNSMSWCVTKKFFGQYGGPPYYAIIRDKDKSPFAMIVPKYMSVDPKQAIRNGTNTNKLSPGDMAEVRPLVQAVIPYPYQELNPSVHIKGIHGVRDFPRDTENPRTVLETIWAYSLTEDEWPEGYAAIAKDPYMASNHAQRLVSAGRKAKMLLLLVP
jgi:hypothetical protein